MKRTYIFLALIILLSIVLRFYRLGAVPVSPDWDEAALGYNAYSLAKTGMDEYGTRYPVSIRSFGDYKPPLYAYMSIVPVALFGLSAWAVRLPSAVFGVVAVIGVFYLVRELFFILPGGREKSGGSVLHGDSLPLVSALLFAVSPWHIQFSRIAFEANLGVTLNIWAITLFLHGLRKPQLFPVSAVLLALGLYAYHSERVFIPLMVILCAIVLRKQVFIRKNAQMLVFSFVAGVVVILPFIISLTDATALERLKGTSTFSNQVHMLARTSAKLEEDRVSGDRMGALLDNRRFVWLKTAAAGYLSHFSLQWLYLNGDNPRHHAPGMGLLYVWELPFLFAGVVTLLRYAPFVTAAIIFGWFFVSPVAASVTTGLPHAVRTLVFLPVFQIVTAAGILSIFRYMHEGIRNRSRGAYVTALSFLLITALYNFGYYLNAYYVHLNPETSEDWQYGYEKVVGITESVKYQYHKIVVSTKLDQSYIFFLFFTGYDPVKYLAQGGSGAIRPGGVRYAFDTYEFRAVDWKNETHDGSVLYVVAPGEATDGIIDTVTFLNGKPGYVFAK